MRRADVEGEPSSWLRTLEDLRALRTAGGRRAAALLVAVLHDGGPLAAELSPERMAALCGALGLEHSHVSMLSRGCFDAALPPDTRRSRQDAELRPLATALAEAAAEYYSAAGERLRAHQVALTAALGSCPPQVAAATAFKVWCSSCSSGGCCGIMLSHIHQRCCVIVALSTRAPTR